MANELIPVTTGTIGARATLICNARDLYAFLEVETRFNDWIARRIEEYVFVEGEDYYSNLSNRSDGLPGRGRTDYHLSLDMAKELGMVERTEQGRKIRRYFIACEADQQRASKPAKPRTQLPRSAPLVLPAPARRIPPDMEAAINARAFEIVSSALPGVHKWLTDQVLRGCITPMGTAAPNFANTLAMADFAAYSTNYASRHLANAESLLRLAHKETALALANVQAERERLSAKGKSQ